MINHRGNILQAINVKPNYDNELGDNVWFSPKHSVIVIAVHLYYNVWFYTDTIYYIIK